MSDSEGELEVAEILGERKSSKRGLEYLVKWKGFGVTENSWEPLKNLSNAAEAIAAFRSKVLPRKKSKSRSKSRSRSRGRSGSRTRSSSKRKSSSDRNSSNRSRSRRSETSKTRSTETSLPKPTVEQTKTETITQSPGRTETTTETLTRSILSPTLTQRSTVVSRTSEVRTTTASEAPPAPAKASGWWQGCCASVQKMQDCCRGLVRSDYPAIVVFATIAVIVLSFVIQQNVDFVKLWGGITAFFNAVWLWLSGVPDMVSGLFAKKEPASG